MQCLNKISQQSVFNRGENDLEDVLFKFKCLTPGATLKSECNLV